MRIGFGSFSMHIGNTTSTQAELWASRQGLSKAWTMGYKNIILEIDSLMVVNMLTIKNVSFIYSYE
jgi:ribonuclease HI